MPIITKQIHKTLNTKWEFILLFLLVHSLTIFSQVYTGPIPKPTSGYGSDGSYNVAVQSFVNPNFPAEEIKIYYPAGITSSVPTLFYSHAYGGENPLHVIGLLRFFAKKGYAIVFVPYPTIGVITINDRYINLLEGFRKAARDFPSIIDTTRVGFIGHSFGGGATIGTSYKCFTENNWGQNGRFICPSAPWYSYNITQTELQSFPADTKMLTFVYENDSINDHRMAVEIFSNINIPASEKDFIKVFSSTVSGYDYFAGHGLPTTVATVDALDYYAYYRLIDALCDYTFNSSLIGKDVALGNGSINQVTMPSGMENLLQTDTHLATNPENIYLFPCSAVANPRQTYCNSIPTSTDFPTNDNHVFMYPNPGNDYLNIKSNSEISRIEFFKLQGQLIKSLTTKNTEVSIPISELTSEIYFVKIYLSNGKLWVDKLIKK
jgi:hypothetical protein